MRYAKRRDDDDTDWTLDEERVVERLVRVRRREAPTSPRVTRKMAKVDAKLLALSRHEDPRASLIPTSPPPRGRDAAMPPPLSIPFPFPFANSASTTMPSVAVLNAELRDSPLSLFPREPDPFTVVPPPFSLPPRSA